MTSASPSSTSSPSPSSASSFTFPPSCVQLLNSLDDASSLELLSVLSSSLTGDYSKFSHYFSSSNASTSPSLSTLIDFLCTSDYSPPSPLSSYKSSTLLLSLQSLLSLIRIESKITSPSSALSQLGVKLLSHEISPLFSEKATEYFLPSNGRIDSVVSALSSSTLKVNRLVDIKWKFGVTASSSHVESVGKTFLQLKISTEKNGETLMELDVNQFFDLLKKCEKAKLMVETF